MNSEQLCRATFGNFDQQCFFCDQPARWHFGTEQWQVPVAYVLDRLTVAGETIHTCGEHGMRLREWARLQEDKELLRGIYAR